MFSCGLQCMGMFPSFERMRKFESFIAEKPISLGVAVSGNDAIPLLLHGSDTNLKRELVAGDLPIVSK